MRRIVAFVLILVCGYVTCMSGCDNKNKEDLVGIQRICELATLKCFYHNVAKVEEDPSGMFKKLGVGYKKMWTEYSGIVELGIDFEKVSISEPDRQGVVTIVLPEVEILSIDLDEDSLSVPLTETGFLTKITKEEETLALNVAQMNMESAAREDIDLHNLAEKRAKQLIESYVKSIDDTYTVKWETAQ